MSAFGEECECVTNIGAINRIRWSDASEREALTPSVTQRCTIDADDGGAA